MARRRRSVSGINFASRLFLFWDSAHVTPMLSSQTAKLLLRFLLFQSETAVRTVNFLKEKQHEGLMFFVPCDPFEVMFDLFFFLLLSRVIEVFLLHNFLFPSFFRRVISCNL